MIKELIILLSDKQQEELTKKAKKAGYDDLECLQLHLNDWLRQNNSVAEALAKGLAKRLTHTEKQDEF